MIHYHVVPERTKWLSGSAMKERSRVLCFVWAQSYVRYDNP